jgi:hypothetical protein
MIPFGISDSKYTNIDFEHVNVSLPIELDFSTPDREIVFSRNSVRAPSPKKLTAKNRLKSQ